MSISQVDRTVHSISPLSNEGEDGAPRRPMQPEAGDQTVSSESTEPYSPGPGAGQYQIASDEKTSNTDDAKVSGHCTSLRRNGLGFKAHINQ